MTAKVQIWNRALSLAGASSTVTDENEASRQAEICRLWYDTVRKATLGAAFWPSARTRAYLPLKKERDFGADWVAGDPAPGWHYSYGTPVDMLRPRFMVDYSVFEESFDPATGTNIISSNTEQAILEYSFDQQITTLWDTNLEMAILVGMAAFICKPLTGKETQTRRLFEQADKIVLDAQVLFANTSNVQQQSVPDWIAVRGYTDAAPKAQFFYPYSPMLSTVGQYSGIYT